MRQRSQGVGGKGKRGLKRIDTLAGENRSECKHYSNYNKLACAFKHPDIPKEGTDIDVTMLRALCTWTGQSGWMESRLTSISTGLFRTEHGMRDAAKMVGVVVGCGGSGRGAARTYL